MRKILLLFLFFSCYICNAQNQQWFNTINLKSYNTIQGVKKDSLGNIYIAGSYSDIHHGNPNPTGGVFVSKYNSQGNLLWSDTSNARMVACRGIETDKVGNSYFAVELAGNSSITFGSFQFTNINYYSSSVIFVKYNSSGVVLWAKQYIDIKPNAITSDSQGNIYVAGCIDGATAQFDSFTLSSQGFIAKFDTTGNCIKLMSMASEVVDITSDGINIYSIKKPNINQPCYIEKYDGSGNFIWSSWVGPAGKIYADPNGNCYGIGLFYGSVTFGSTTLTDPYYNQPQWCVVKMNTNGNYLWAIAPTDSLAFLGITVNSFNLYLTGSYGYPSNSNNGLHITKYDSNGTNVSVKKIPVMYNGFNLLTDGQSIYVGGSSLGEYGPAFISKFSESSVGIIETENNSYLNVYPNPTGGDFQINYFSTEKTKLQLNIIDSKGKIVYTETFQGDYNKAIDLGTKAKGVYFVEIIAADKKRAVKKIMLN